jgi:surface protein
MKSLNEFIQESILSSTKSGYNGMAEIIYNKLLNGEKLTNTELKFTNKEVGVFKVDKAQLKNLLRNLKYNDISLNWLDVSEITDMSHLFEMNTRFNGDISKWDVSKVTDMTWMFFGSKFNGDISGWDVSKVTNMFKMFASTSFNNDISKWDVSRVGSMNNMFNFSEFNGDISDWDVSNVEYMRSMFAFSIFNRDISKWDVSSVETMETMFVHSQFNQDISGWDINKKCSRANIFKDCPIKDEYKPKILQH